MCFCIRIPRLLSGQLGTSFTVNLAPFTSIAADANALIEKVNQVLLQGRMSNELRQIMVTAAEAISGDNTQRTIGALYLAAISSEYTVQQ